MWLLFLQKWLSKGNCASLDVTGMSKADLWKEYIVSQDEAIKDRLIMNYLEMVKNIAGRLSVKLPPGMHQEDLESCGMIGLMEAIDKYDPEMNTEFEAFAYYRIRGAMYDEIRKANWIPRTTWKKVSQLYDARCELEQARGRTISDQELSREMGMTVGDIKKINSHLINLTSLSLDGPALEDSDQESLRLADIFPDPGAPDPLQEVCTAGEQEILAKSIRMLNERDQLVLALYYQEELTLREIGQVLEVSESRVCQLHSRAIARLRKELVKLLGV